MFFLKKIHFQKSLYPIFYHNLEVANQNESAIVFMRVESELLKIMVIINFKVVIFEKRINAPMTIQNFVFTKELNNGTNELYSLIKQTKYNATTVKSEHFIEHFAELINRIKILYTLTLEQQQIIWKEVFSLDKDFFQSNITIVLPEGTSNKWVD